MMITHTDRNSTGCRSGWSVDFIVASRDGLLVKLKAEIESEQHIESLDSGCAVGCDGRGLGKGLHLRKVNTTCSRVLYMP